MLNQPKIKEYTFDASKVNTLLTLDIQGKAEHLTNDNDANEPVNIIMNIWNEDSKLIESGNDFNERANGAALCTTALACVLAGIRPVFIHVVHDMKILHSYFEDENLIKINFDPSLAGVSKEFYWKPRHMAYDLMTGCKLSSDILADPKYDDFLRMTSRGRKETDGSAYSKMRGFASLLPREAIMEGLFPLRTIYYNMLEDHFKPIYEARKAKFLKEKAAWEAKHNA